MSKIRIVIATVLPAAVAIAGMIQAPENARAGEDLPFQPRMNFATGRCLDDSAVFGLGTVPCNSLAFQQWRHSANGAVDNENTKRCLDDSPKFGVRSLPCNGLDFQKWTLRFAPPEGIKASQYFLINQNTKRCLEGSPDFPVHSAPCDGSRYQQWSPDAPPGFTHLLT